MGTSSWQMTQESTLCKTYKITEIQKCRYVEIWNGGQLDARHKAGHFAKHTKILNCPWNLIRSVLLVAYEINFINLYLHLMAKVEKCRNNITLLQLKTKGCCMLWALAINSRWMQQATLTGAKAISAKWEDMAAIVPPILYWTWVHERKWLGVHITKLAVPGSRSWLHMTRQAISWAKPNEQVEGYT